MNLTTARSVKRAREIGVRKVVGAVRGVLIRQFIGEAMFLTFIAVVISIVLVIILLPVFQLQLLKEIAYPFSHLSFWLWLFGLTFLNNLGFYREVYPALLSIGI